MGGVSAGLTGEEPVRVPRFERRLHECHRLPLHRTRQAAIERFTALGFPTLEDEEWRFTNLASLIRTSFRLAERGTDGAASAGQIERLAILQTLERTRGNKRAAAAMLGIHRPTLYNKLRKYGLWRAEPVSGGEDQE